MPRRITLAVAALALAGAASSTGRAQDDPAAASAAIEACLRANAERVERAFESLTEASSFLIANVCAKPVADASQAAQRQQQARQRERLEAACAQIGDDPSARFGNPMAAQCDNLAFMDVYSDWEEAYAYGFGAGAPPEMLGLAATLLLDARLARQAGD